jgi:multidrug resistance efflux pump
MIELMLCSMLTILPDYLFRRYAQGKRIGREINLYTMWFELRWGITACLMLTISLVTLIFYFHPATKAVTAMYRTVTILPETNGRVADVYVGINDKVEAGQPLFRLDSSRQQAAVETARRNIAEVNAATEVARTELVAADGQIRQAEGAYRQTLRELETKVELRQRSPNTVSPREIEQLEINADRLHGAIDAARANKETLQTKLDSLLPAQKASAEAALAEAEVDLGKTVVRAGVTGTVQQFTLRKGDVVNPMIRPAGILVPATAGRLALVAGFGQIEAQVIKKGMIAEVTCVGRPFAIIPMVVTDVQDVIAAGQYRPVDRRVANGPARNHHRVPRTAVRGRAGGCPSRRHLHCQRLHRQPSRTRLGPPRRVASALPARGRRRRHRACRHTADPGAAASGADAGVHRPLNTAASRPARLNFLCRGSPRAFAVEHGMTGGRPLRQPTTCRPLARRDLDPVIRQNLLQYWNRSGRLARVAIVHCIRGADVDLAAARIYAIQSAQ